MVREALRIFPSKILGAFLLRSFFIASLIFSGLLLVRPAHATVGINDTLSFQGKVVNINGTNVADGNYDFIFKMYTVSSGGSATWTETWNSGTSQVVVTDGIFQVDLGTHTDLPGSVDFNTDNIYVGITFNGDGEMTPRVRLTAVPQAFNSDNLDGVDGLSFLRSDISDNFTSGTLTFNDSTVLAVGTGNDLQLMHNGTDSIITSTTGDLVIDNTLATGSSIFRLGTDTSATDFQIQNNSESALFTVNGAGIVVITTALSNYGNTILGNANSDTLIINAGSSGSGISFADASFATCTALETSGGVLTCGSDGGGGGGTLQDTYAGDVDGSNTTISLTSADDSLVITNPASSGTDSAFAVQIDQANTTDAVSALDIIQRSSNANAVAITANTLTSGKGVDVSSSSTAFTGKLAEITLSGSNAANTGNLLKLSNTGTANANTSLYVDHRATGTGNLAFRVDDEASDATPVIIDGDGRVGIGTSALSSASATERLLQVGSETNRGNSVTYGEVATKGLKEIIPLTDIKDVFLYDTTADSDGGRWIDWATTDRLSWYSEAVDDGPNDPCNIASDDRCYASAFPRKAILVVTGSALYIFDATNNVMWMKFSQNASGYALGVDTNNDPSSVTALNGVIYVGAKGTASGGLYALDFVNDRMWNYDATDRAGANVGISGRNSAVTYASDTKTSLQLDPVGTSAEWMNINDVSAVSINSSLSAITIGAATNVNPGQGQSFVALATDSGVTVINLAAQNLLQYSDVTADNYEAVTLTRSGKLYALNSTSDQLEKWDAIDSDKASEVNGTYTSRWNSTVGPALAVGAVAIQTNAPDALEVVERGSLAENNMDLIYVGHDLGLTEIHDHTTVTNGWSKFYNTTRQTMLMPNAIDSALPLDEASGTIAQDASFNNTDMSYKGTFTLGASGVRGKAVALGNAGYLCSDADANGTCDNDASFNSGTAAFNISMWFKHSTTAPATPDVLFEKCYNTTPAATVGCVTAYMTTTGTIVGAIDATTTFTQFSAYDVMATSTLAYNDDQWHFLVMSRDNANDMNVYIDGQALNLSTATGQTATVDAASQVTSIGASCSASANCATGTNFWDGSIDDFTFSSGATTVSNLLSAPAHRLYNDARPLVGKRTITVTDATSVSSTTIGDSGEAWIPNEFSGLMVELTGGTGAGQSRRVIGNTTTTLTVSPAFDTTPDTTTDFEIDPESLYGASDIVSGIGITAESPLGEARMMCAGTNSTSDTGGVTCYNHQAGPNVVAEVFHAGAKKLDDSTTEWTGTDYDDIKSIDLSGRSLYIGSMAHMYSRTEDVRLGQGLDYLANQLFNIRGEIIQDGVLLTGSLGLEIGFTGGADLAENYRSLSSLVAGELVTTSGVSDMVDRSTKAYQNNLIGVVSTLPGLVLGEIGDGNYPIALVGRVPVQVTTQNGSIKHGDSITSSDTPGFGMRATLAGRVIGTALEDLSETNKVDCPDGVPTGTTCGIVMVFVNPIDSLGQGVELAMTDWLVKQAVHQVGPVEIADPALGMTVPVPSNDPIRSEQILVFLDGLKADREAIAKGASSQVFADRVSAVWDIIAPEIITDKLSAKEIHVDKIVAKEIEGLEIWTDKISSLSAKLSNLSSPTPLPTELPSTTTSPEPSTQITGIATATLDTLQTQGALTVTTPAEFKQKTIFGFLAEFIGSVKFMAHSVFSSTVDFLADVTFTGRPIFNKDTAGFAVIRKGVHTVDVVFENPYTTNPIVTANIAFDYEKAKKTQQDLEAQKNIEDNVLSGSLQYLITNKTVNGFTIKLNMPAPEDMQFSWTALAVQDARTTFSKQYVEAVVDPDPTFTPAPEPSNEPVPEESESPLPLPPVEIAPSPEPSPTLEELPVSGILIKPSVEPVPSISPIIETL